MPITAPSRETLEKIIKTVRQYNGGRAEAARALGMPATTLKGRLDLAKRLGMDVPPPPAFGFASNFEAASQTDALKQKIEELTKLNRHLTETAYDVEQMKAWIHDVKKYNPKPPKWLLDKPKKDSMGTPVLVVSDWHWGETVLAAQVNGVNAYNRDIATRRMQRMFKTAVELWTRYMATPIYDRFVLAIIGDMLSGTIHEELSETNWDRILPSSWDLAEHLIAGIDLLLQHFPKVEIPCVVGNHGRLHKKPRYKNRQVDNYEWNLLHILARHYRLDDRVHFDISDSGQLPFSIYNTRFIASHGDEYRGGGGISGSWSPIVRGDAKQRKQAMAISQPYQYRIIGHWHFLEQVQNVRKNGSGKGFDEMSLHEGYDPQTPMQDMFLVHPVMGITFEAPVYLENPGTTFNVRTDEAL